MVTPDVCRQPIASRDVPQLYGKAFSAILRYSFKDEMLSSSGKTAHAAAATVYCLQVQGSFLVMSGLKSGWSSHLFILIERWLVRSYSNPSGKDSYRSF